MNGNSEQFILASRLVNYILLLQRKGLPWAIKANTEFDVFQMNKIHSFFQFDCGHLGEDRSF